MPWSEEEHFQNLIRHIDLVRDACILLGKRIMSRGEREFGRLLIARGFVHDASKFTGIEWKFLHQGPDVPNEALKFAIEQHVSTNDHHPEFWGGIDLMPPLAICEMICDWYGRSQEFSTSLRDWITKEAIDRFKIDLKSHNWSLINEYVDLLLKDSFKR